MATTLDIPALFERYAQTFRTREPDLIVELHTIDTVFWQRTDQAPAVGRKAVRDAFRALFAHWPELGFDVRRVLTGKDFWILDWTLTSTSNGRTVGFDCLDVVCVNADGLVTSKHTFVDLVQARKAIAVAAAQPRV